MNRKYFAIWFAIFTLLQWFSTTSFGGVHFLLEMVLIMVVFAVVFGNIIGLIPFYYALRHAFNDFRLYHINSSWFRLRYQYDYPSEVSDTFILWHEDILPMLLSGVVILHLYISAKRCKNIGISAWWSLVPLYNPIMLLFKKSKADREETVQN